jgi:hypothetical protein
MTQDRSPIGVNSSPECRRDMLVKHFLSVSNGEMLNFRALKCRMWPTRTSSGAIVMQFSHLFLHRTIDFCSAAIYVGAV